MFRSLATKQKFVSFNMAYEMCSEEAIIKTMLSRKHLKFMKSGLGRREGTISGSLLSKNF